MKVKAFFYFLLKLFTLHLSSVECKTKCLIKGETADCTRLKLTAVPSDLPENISDLDMAHNQLHGLPSSAMSRYKELIYLDASYNSIQKIDPELCLVLPHLQALKVQHNEVHLLSEKDLKYCLNLTELNLSGNRLKMTADTFRHLQNLKILDVSKNELKSVNLGMSPQLPSLQVLNLSENKISEIKNEDFIYLSNSSLQLLKLASLPLKIERDIAAGTFELEAIIESMSKSRKIVFIITNALLNDPWCKRVLCKIMTFSGCGASVGEERFIDHDFANDAVIFDLGSRETE
ncbi:TLR3 protein, partial [Polypterus senegalus]